MECRNNNCCERESAIRQIEESIGEICEGLRDIEEGTCDIKEALKCIEQALCELRCR